MDLLGKEVLEKILKEAGVESEALREKNIIPTLGILRVGENKSDIAYEKSIINLMKKADIEVSVNPLPVSICESDFIKELEKFNNDDNIGGILIFRPLPKGIDEKKISTLINPKKDIDSFSPINLAKVFTDDESGFYPCTPMGAIEILDYYNIPLEGKNVVVLGRSLVVGKPLSMMLLKRNATVTICHSKTKDLPDICKNADIIISAIGRGNMIDERYTSKKSILIDVGINFVNGKMVGDADYEKVSGICDKITPVPGGVGGVTTAVLAKNIIKAYKIR